jgi:hypothetical protein
MHVRNDVYNLWVGVMPSRRRAATDVWDLRFYILGYDAVQSVESQPFFRVAAKLETSVKQVAIRALLHAGFLLVLHSKPDDGGDISLRNVG